MRFILSTLLIFPVLFCVGCGKATDPNRTPVSGSVIFEGEALRCGSIVFTSTEDAHRRATCMIRSDGTYSVANAPKGKVIITVETASVSPKLGGPAEFYKEIPKEFGNVETSGLSLEVPPGGMKDYVITLKK